MIDIKQFSALQKNSKASFFQQKKIVKKVMAGQTVLCTQCNQPLILITPEQDEKAGIRCAKGCTDIQLDFV
ncbi:MAG: hypothetical protein OCD00_00630 [Colwellia sp.]